MAEVQKVLLGLAVCGLAACATGHEDGAYWSEAYSRCRDLSDADTRTQCVKAQVEQLKHRDDLRADLEYYNSQRMWENADIRDEEAARSQAAPGEGKKPVVDPGYPLGNR